MANKNNILSAKQIADGLSKNRLTEAELSIIVNLDRDNVSQAEWTVIEKYNAYVMYQNANTRVQWESAVLVSKEQGPGSYFQQTEDYEVEGTTETGSLVPPYLAADTGELFDLFKGPIGWDKGRTDYDQLSDQTFLFTEDGVIPLSDQVAKDVKNYQIKEGRAANFMFNLEGDSETIMNLGGRNQEIPIWYREPNRDPKLPPGVVEGIPEGENREDYVSVGKIEDINGSRAKGDSYLYVKVLDRPTSTSLEQRNIGEPVPIYPTMPEPPEYLDVITVNGSVEQPVEEMTEETNYIRETVAPYRRKDPILKENTEDNVIVQEDHIPQEPTKDPLFGANLLANVSKGLEGWNLQGVNIPVPDYDQQRYQSGELGPAVQNLFRGGR